MRTGIIGFARIAINSAPPNTPITPTYRETRRMAIRKAIDNILSFITKHNLAHLTDNVLYNDPTQWGFGHGHYVEPFHKEHQQLAVNLAIECWRDPESILAFIDILRDMRDPDSLRTTVLYAGGPIIAKYAKIIEGEDADFGRQLLSQIYSESDPWIRVALVRGFKYASQMPYNLDELLTFASFIKTESVMPNIYEGLDSLIPHIAKYPEIRDFVISEATQSEASGLNRVRQVHSARILCGNPALRDDGAIWSTAIQLLGRSGDPAIQYAAISYLNMIGNSPAERPDLSVNIYYAARYLESLISAFETYREIGVTPDGHRYLYKDMIEKVADFDMPRAASYTEDYLRDPNQSDAVKSHVIWNIGMRTLYDKEKAYPNSWAHWQYAIRNVAADPVVSEATRLEAFNTLIVIGVRSSNLDREGAIANIASVIELMKMDPSPAIRKAGNDQLDRARSMGLIK